MKLVMDLVVNHTSDEHPWFVESRSSRDNPKRDWYWWRPAAPGMEPGEPGAEPTNWGVVLLRPGLGARRGDRRVLPAPVLAASSPTSTGRTPRSAQAVYAMMRWWLDRGRRRLPDGRHQHDLQGPGAARRPAVRGGPLRRRLAVLHQRPAHPRVPAGDAPRGVRRPRASLLTVGEMPGRHRRRGPAVHRPGPGEVDMVFQFEHVGLDQRRRRKWDAAPARPARPQGQSFGRWQAGLADVGWNSLYWNNHDQPRVVSRFGDDGELPGRVGQDARPPCCTCTAARRTSTRARSSA